MRTLQWQKIPIANVLGKANLWTMVGRMGENYEMDYTKMDALFSVNQDGGPKRPGFDTDTVDSKKKKENQEINILDGKRSLNVNIFLKQFRLSHEEIVSLVREGRGEVFGAERLRGLLKLLPSQDEIDAIKAFDGDREKLGNAEKFFIVMMTLPNYRMRIEGLLIMEEFNTNMEWIRPSVEAVIQASKDIQENKSLKELIFLILIAGNYLNSGNYAGNAAGFKLSSLLKLTELRANKPRMNLLHYVAEEAKEKNPKLLDFPQEMRFLKDASQVSVETLVQDISNIANKVKAITEQIVVAGVDFQQQMEHFLKEANIEVLELEEDLNEIETMRTEMATFFAEDQRTFKLEECFSILQSFCERFQKAISENQQRHAQEKKAEKRMKLTEEEKLKRNSKELPDSPSDNSMDQSSSIEVEEEDTSIVDMLLADVRSGFTSRKFNDGNFSVKKVTKVNLLEALSTDNATAASGSATEGSTPSPTPSGSSRNPPSFIRGGYGRVSQRKKLLSSRGEDPSPSPTPGSDLNQRRSRRSYATEDNESLIDFLTECEENYSPPTEQAKPETTFERYGSLRRRHQERKDKKKSALEVIMPGRELASSPSIPESPAENRTEAVFERLQPDKLQEHVPRGSLRRTRSLLDRSSVERANAELRKSDTSQEDSDSSDALLDRIKQKLNKKAEDRHARLEDVNNERISGNLGDEESSRFSRWRSGITTPDNPLNTISEKSVNDNNPHRVVRREKSDSSAKLKYRNSIDPSEFSRLMRHSEIGSRSPRSQDDSVVPSPNVAVSVRKQISSGIGTNIDQVLKTIEDSGRTIDTVGVSGPIKRTPEVTTPKVEVTPSSQVAVVAHVNAPYRPITPISEHDLKTKRDKRKKRSTLSLEDVKAAMKSDGPKSSQPDQNISSSTSSIRTDAFMNERNTETVVYYQAETGKPVAKTPPSPRRSGVEIEQTTQESSPSNKELSKAAKLAAKKKFRDARFGDSSGNSDKMRTKSNVEPDGVNQALKEMANKTTMSRSKSYDEHVAKNEDNEFSSNVIGRSNNGGSAPDTYDEKKAVRRNSSSRSSLDGRRNGLYIPSDESDTDLTPEDTGRKRSSVAKSDSPQSVSQLSLKSTNTSTETLQADIESSPEQRRKSSGSLSQKVVIEAPSSPPQSLSQTQSTPTNFLGEPMVPRPQSTTAIDLEESTLRRSYSLMERTRLHNDDDDGDNPLAKMAKWRMNRNRHRRSIYDNVGEGEPNRSLLSPTNSLNTDSSQPFKTEVSELKNEVGSRSSYASSCASSNERDEGFETGSGTASQRTSMSSTIDSDIYAAAAAAGMATPATTTTMSMPRKEAVCKSLSIGAKLDSEKTVISSFPERDSVISSLSVEADRKERTESWTEQTVRANNESIISKDQSCDSSSDYAALSPDSGHSTSKEDIWSEESEARHDPKDSKKKTSTSTGTSKASVTKTKSVPNYMKSTSSSSASKGASKTNNKPAPAPPSSSSSVSPFRRDTPQRISVKEKETTATLRRDMSMRASMRAEPVSAGFQRGTVARKSMRGPRTTAAPATTTPKASTSVSSASGSSTTRVRSDSTASISSTASSASNISSTMSSSSTTRRVSSSNKSSSSIRPTTPSSPNKGTVTMRSKTPVPSTPSTTSRLSAGSIHTPTSYSQTADRAKKSLSADSTTPKRSVTPLSHELKRSSTPLSHDGSRSTTPLPERPRSTTPLSESRGTPRRSSFMAPTAASKAKKDASEGVTGGLKSKTDSSKSGPLLRTASLRLPKKSTDATPDVHSGRKSPAVVSSSGRKSPAVVSSGRKSPAVSTSGRKSPATVDSPLLHKGEHYQSLSTVAEQDEEATKGAEETTKKSPSLLKRIGIVKSKSSVSPTTKTKTSNVSASSRK